MKAAAVSAPADAAGPGVIAKDFGWLESWSKPGSTLRWHLWIEKPGSPDVERSDDLVRDVQRRGWMLDDAGGWHWIDTMSSGKGGTANKHWSLSNDGWISMGMGYPRSSSLIPRPWASKSRRLKPQEFYPGWARLGGRVKRV